MSADKGHVPGTAVILAAGMGTRLSALGMQAPKGFLKLGADPIIVESLDKLERAGLARIVIVTGHLHGFYDRLAASWTAVRSGPGRRDGPAASIVTVHNARYADSGSMCSLYEARGLLAPQGGARAGAGAGPPGRSAPFLLLESDLIYEARALEAVMDHPAESVVLLSGRTGSGDEVWAEAPEGVLRKLSKNLDEIEGRPAGELVGISKIGPRLFAAMLEESERLFRDGLNIEYEAVLTAASGREPVPCLLIDDLRWAEIDDENHLDRARRQVYPQL